MEFEIGDIVYDDEDIMQIVSEQEFIDSEQHSYIKGEYNVFVKILHPIQSLRKAGNYYTNDCGVDKMRKVPKLILILFGE